MKLFGTIFFFLLVLLAVSIRAEEEFDEGLTYFSYRELVFLILHVFVILLVTKYTLIIHLSVLQILPGPF